ncbi:MAG: RNA-directed DNA polymerase [Elusimicrobia bacterium]|nr:RNA-directed DNA polymerase [Elusimicrobiota bacterium]
MTSHRARKKNYSASVLDMSNVRAEGFFLKDESYCTFDLPPYFSFKAILKKTDKLLKKVPLSNFQKSDPKEADRINHVILTNKDGKYSWRPMQLIHPALYVSLVKKITEVNSWKKLNKRFAFFSKNSRIRCLSIPAETKGKDAAGQVSNWWQEVEQKSIELSLEYEYIAHADITNCYGSIYTHSIAWAIHGQKWAKRHRQPGHLGNDIDRHLQAMNFGQTNGIPQGSALMNFVAEIVLGYSDLILSLKLKGHGVCDYRILRFRDDYRIFVNQPKDGEEILKCLSETMHALGMKLHPSKTGLSREVIRQSIKPDKLSWICRKHSEKDIQNNCSLSMRFRKSILTRAAY